MLSLTLNIPGKVSSVLKFHDDCYSELRCYDNLIYKFNVSRNFPPN